LNSDELRQKASSEMSQIIPENGIYLLSFIFAQLLTKENIDPFTILQIS
jgi:hypothetical protein